MGNKLKRNISEIVTPVFDEIPSRRTLISHVRHLKASAKLVVDMWCIDLKRAGATLGATTQRGFRSDIIPLAQRYRAERVFSMRRLNAHFATDTLFFDVKSLIQNICAHIFHIRLVSTQHIQWYCHHGTL